MELQTVSGIDCWALKEDGCSTIDDDTLINIMQDLFPSKMNPKPDSGFIYQSNYFDYYFNDTSTKAITDNKMMELLSSPTEELKTILNPYLHDKMSYQTIKELLERYGKEDFIKSLLDNKDSKLLILNYFKACYIFNADNGLTYSEGLAPVKIGKGKFAYFNEL